MKKRLQRKKSASPKRRLRVLVTAGPTREFFDPVRFLSNPSSGKMGYAIAAEAARRGHRVVLVSGPVALPPPGKKIRLIRVISADEMRRAVLKHAKTSDLIIMSAAVSDFRPAHYLPKKLKKTGKDLVIRFLPNPDILKELGRRKRPGQILVGFAAETDQLRTNAMKKLRKKNLDVIVANRVGSSAGGFESDRNEAVLYSASGGSKRLSLRSKQRMAADILNFIFSSAK